MENQEPEHNIDLHDSNSADSGKDLTRSVSYIVDIMSNVLPPLSPLGISPEKVLTPPQGKALPILQASTASNDSASEEVKSASTSLTFLSTSGSSLTHGSPLSSSPEEIGARKRAVNPPQDSSPVSGNEAKASSSFSSLTSSSLTHVSPLSSSPEETKKAVGPLDSASNSGYEACSSHSSLTSSSSSHVSPLTSSPEETKEAGYSPDSESAAEPKHFPALNKAVKRILPSDGTDSIDSEPDSPSINYSTSSTTSSSEEYLPRGRVKRVLSTTSSSSRSSTSSNEEPKTHRPAGPQNKSPKSDAGSPPAKIAKYSSSIHPR